MAAVPDSLAVVVADLRGFLFPLTESPQAERLWRKGGPWSDGRGVDA
jgi:hypothetical protein